MTDLEGELSLHVRRELLLRRSADLRAGLQQRGAAARPVLHGVDAAVDAAQLIGRHKGLVLGASLAAAALMLRRPRRAFRLGVWSLGAWRAARDLRPVWRYIVRDR